ncbi:PqiA/YebS family transporter subunit [Enterovibrio norvegicus]|uniref:PqiA/YebS family transporter subunit n=1 Tax=Enterovibrio norvegicus TaxID=188144 RepID=UPI001056D8D0|nr:PqiA/YebS family transporter subunit [Enterovibrio norvegicus]
MLNLLDKCWKYRLQVVCHLCDHVSNVPELDENQVAICRVCGGHVVEGAKHDDEKVIAFATTASILLLCSLLFELISFSRQGLVQSMGLMDVSLVMVKHQYEPLGALMAATITMLPASLLLFAFILHTPLRKLLSTSLQIFMTKAIFFCKDWSMPEIFLVAVLVSLVKITSLADIGMGLSFWAYIGFVVFFLLTMLNINRKNLWDTISHHASYPQHPASGRAIDATISGCHTCDLVTKESKCPRCHSKVHTRKPQSVQKTLAWLATAFLLYIPANIEPILITVFLNSPEPSTIIGGVAVLIEHGSYPIAIVIFVASVMLPLAKMAAFALFCWVVTKQKNICRLSFTQIYTIAEFLGKWSMIDVYVVAVLAALVQLSGMMEIVPGIGAVYFSLMVIASMIAAHSFDPKLLWDLEQKQANKE